MAVRQLEFLMLLLELPKEVVIIVVVHGHYAKVTGGAGADAVLSWFIIVNRGPREVSGQQSRILAGGIVVCITLRIYLVAADRH